MGELLEAGCDGRVIKDSLILHMSSLVSFHTFQFRILSHFDPPLSIFSKHTEEIFSVFAVHGTDASPINK